MANNCIFLILICLITISLHGQILNENFKTSENQNTSSLDELNRFNNLTKNRSELKLQNQIYQFDSLINSYSHGFEEKIHLIPNEQSEYWFLWARNSANDSFNPISFDEFIYNEKNLLSFRSRNTWTGNLDSVNATSPFIWSSYRYNEDDLIEELIIQDTFNQNNNSIRFRAFYTYDENNYPKTEKRYNWDFSGDSLIQYFEYRYDYNNDGLLNFIVSLEYDENLGWFPEDSITYSYNLDNSTDSIYTFLHGKNRTNYRLSNIQEYKYNSNKQVDSIAINFYSISEPCKISSTSYIEYIYRPYGSLGEISTFKKDTVWFSEFDYEIESLYADSRIYTHHDTITSEEVFRGHSSAFFIEEIPNENHARKWQTYLIRGTESWLEFESMRHFFYSAKNMSTTTETQPTQSSIRISPNPTSEYLTIEFSDYSKKFNFQISDIHGNKISNELVRSGEPISVAGLNPGVYIYSALIEGKIQSGKFVKSR